MYLSTQVTSESRATPQLESNKNIWAKRWKKKQNELAPLCAQCVILFKYYFLADYEPTRDMIFAEFTCRSFQITYSQSYKKPFCI